jgi:hypothetical protein
MNAFNGNRILGYVYVSVGALLLFIVVGELFLRLIIAYGALFLVNSGLRLLNKPTVQTFMRGYVYRKFWS